MIADELLTGFKPSVTVDCSHRDGTRVGGRVLVKYILHKYAFPPARLLPNTRKNPPGADFRTSPEGAPVRNGTRNPAKLVSSTSCCRYANLGALRAAVPPANVAYSRVMDTSDDPGGSAPLAFVCAFILGKAPLPGLGFGAAGPGLRGGGCGAGRGEAERP